MKLLEMQREMRAWMTGDESAAMRFETRARAGLDVYQNNYRAQLVACLGETFERVKAWLGDDAFLEAAARHIDASPPSSWTLDHYGREFPRTLRELYPLDPEVAELAWLDRTLGEAFVGPDVELLSSHMLAATDWDRAVFEFTPTLTLGEVSTNAAALWSALSVAERPPSVERLPQTATVLVWRKEFTPCFRTIDATEAKAITHLQAGATFGSLCAMLIATDGEAAGVSAAGELLARWLQDGVVIGVD